VNLSFQKYQGTGNDFIMLDNWDGQLNGRDIPVAKLCDRRFGLGADGLIVMQKDSGSDFEMVYYNADGSQSFCGNGSRCAVRYAHSRKWIKETTRFLSTDGYHSAKVNGNNIELLMHDVHIWDSNENVFTTNTGSPHYIQFIENLDDLDIIQRAREIRYSNQYKKDGINVNFVKPEANFVTMRTYERGVEDETLSCGTGVTAVALMQHVRRKGGAGEFLQEVHAPGGELGVRFTFDGKVFSNIWLIGPAEFVFSGSILI